MILSKKYNKIIPLFLICIYFLGAMHSYATKPSDFGLKEGNLISASDSGDPDVFIVNEYGYKRLFLNPVIFNYYGHLGGFSKVKSVSAQTRDSFPTTGLFRNCEKNDTRVYALRSTGEDTAELQWLNMTGAAVVDQDSDFFKKVFCINNKEFNWYQNGTPVISTNDVQAYDRTKRWGQSLTKICHHASENFENWQTIEVADPSLVPGHLAHGDTLGTCLTPTPVPTVTPAPVTGAPHLSAINTINSTRYPYVWYGDLVQLNVTSSQPYKLAKEYQEFTTPAGIVIPGTGPSGTTDYQGSWSSIGQVSSIGKWKKWVEVDGVKSNVIEFYVIQMYTTASTPTPVTTTINCSASGNLTNVYVNTKYQYCFNYPSGWTIERINSVSGSDDANDDPQTLYIGSPDNPQGEYVVGPSLYNYNIPTSTNKGIKHGFTLTLDMPSLSSDDFIAYWMSNTNIKGVERFSINDMEAVSYYFEPNTSPNGLRTGYVYIKNKSGNWVYSFIYIEHDLDVEKTIKDIIKTFMAN